MITADAIDLPVSARHFIEFHSDLYRNRSGGAEVRSALVAWAQSLRRWGGHGASAGCTAREPVLL